MNLLLWTTRLGPEHQPILAALAEMGYDLVEVPVFDLEDIAGYERLGRDIRDLGLEPLAVTAPNAEQNICADMVECAAALGAKGASSTEPT
jgi:D-psicose/D-tagatose/L-ribulose 3-epimerase